ncbi:MAG: hypothetical protein AAGJ40_02780 [Planctomycetota bacterium]
MCRFLAACVLLSIAGFAVAVDVEPINKRDTPITIRHEAGEVIRAIFVDSSGEWKTLGDEHFRRGELETTFAAPPGQYLLTAGDSTIVRVVEEGKPTPPGPRPEPRPDPEPEPDPQPDPEPNPNPPILAKWVIWVEEQSERSSHPDEVAVMMDPGLRESMEDRGLKVRVYDKDLSLGKKYANIAEDLPAMFLVESADEYRSFPAPKTKDEAERIIRENVVR